MFNMKPTSLTDQRNSYKEKLINRMGAIVAQDLADGHTEESIGVHALGAIIAAVAPNSGEGHADRAREYAGELVQAAQETDKKAAKAS